VLAFLFVNYIQQYNKQDMESELGDLVPTVHTSVCMKNQHFRRMSFDCAAYKSQLGYVLELS